MSRLSDAEIAEIARSDPSIMEQILAIFESRKPKKGYKMTPQIEEFLCVDATSSRAARSLYGFIDKIEATSDSNHFATVSLVEAIAKSGMTIKEVEAQDTPPVVDMVTILARITKVEDLHPILHSLIAMMRAVKAYVLVSLKEADQEDTKQIDEFATLEAKKVPEPIRAWFQILREHLLSLSDLDYRCSASRVAIWLIMFSAVGDVMRAISDKEAEIAKEKEEARLLKEYREAKESDDKLKLGWYVLMGQIPKTVPHRRWPFEVYGFLKTWVELLEECDEYHARMQREYEFDSKYSKEG